jgi:multiple antibiotic resistance protein
MDELLGFALFCFVSLFAMVEPLGVMPVFISMTSTLPPKVQRSVARRAVFIAFVTLLLFAVTGQLIFSFFNISVHSLKIVGGVIFFIMGYEMLQARISRTTVDEESVQEASNDIALTPLGIPMICGPGAIANVMVLMHAANTVFKQAVLLGVIVLVMSVTLYLLLTARRVAKFLGESGNKVIMRLMGLITMVIAVEFFFSGLKPFVQDMLRPPQE